MGLFEKATKEERVIEAPTAAYETELDKLYYAVKEAGNISLKELSAKLNISPNILEKYAKILEENGLITLYYPSIGSMRLIKKGIAVKKPANKKKNLLIFAVVLLILISAVIAYLKLYVI